jgi:hypothetical protein
MSRFLLNYVAVRQILRIPNPGCEATVERHCEPQGKCNLHHNATKLSPRGEKWASRFISWLCHYGVFVLTIPARGFENMDRSPIRMSLAIAPKGVAQSVETWGTRNDVRILPTNLICAQELKGCSSIKEKHSRVIIHPARNQHLP